MGLILLGRSLIPVAALLAGWGLIGTAAPVAWWTWLSKVLPDDAEARRGLMVSVIQLAITAASSLGGLLFDASGYPATFGFIAMILCASGRVAVPLDYKSDETPVALKRAFRNRARPQNKRFADSRFRKPARRSLRPAEFLIDAPSFVRRAASA